MTHASRLWLALIIGPASQLWRSMVKWVFTIRISESQPVSGTWTPSFYGYDGEDHVRFLTNVSGAVTDTYDYDAFLSRDPLDAGNKYTYSNAEPVNGSDPSGLLFKPTYQPAIAVGTGMFATGVYVAVPYGTTGTGFAIGGGVFTVVGATFICIEKYATDAALKTANLPEGYFGIVIDAFASGCRAPATATLTQPDQEPDSIDPPPPPPDRPKCPEDEGKPLPIYFITGYPQISQATTNAFAQGRSPILTRCFDDTACSQAHHNQTAAARATFRKENNVAANDDVHEYPPAVVREGGTKAYLEAVSRYQNRSEGTRFRFGFLPTVMPGCKLLVVPLP